jgi:hypothetical protein
VLVVENLFQPSPLLSRDGARDTGLPDLLAEPQSVRLIRAFSKISDNTVRLSIVQLTEKFAKSP